MQTTKTDQSARMRRLIWVFVVLTSQKVRMFSYIAAFIITKTRLYNTDPLKPHFYIVKLGLTGVYIIFLISAQKHRLWYSLEPPRRGGSNEYTQSMFWAEICKISEFFIWKFSVFEVKVSIYFYFFELACFRNVLTVYIFGRFTLEVGVSLLVPISNTIKTLSYLLK